MRFAILTLILASALACPALAHPHINITPASTDAGAQLTISHYGDAQLAIRNENSRLELWYGSGIYQITADTVQPDGPYAGFLAGPIFNFTADAAPDLIATAGPVGYEILSVQRIDAAGNARLVWKFTAHHGNGNPQVGDHILRWADSEADTRSGRSFLHNVGDHAHGDFSVFLDAPGLYDVTLRAWDTTGHFADSEPVTFQVLALPEPASVALLTIGAGLLLSGRRRKPHKR